MKLFGLETHPHLDKGCVPCKELEMGHTALQALKCCLEFQELAWLEFIL